MDKLDFKIDGPNKMESKNELIDIEKVNEDAQQESKKADRNNTNPGKDKNYGILRCKNDKEVKELHKNINTNEEILDYSIYQDQVNTKYPEYFILIEFQNVNIKKEYKPYIMEVNFPFKKDFIKFIKMKGADEIDIEEVYSLNNK